MIRRFPKNFSTPRGDRSFIVSSLCAALVITLGAWWVLCLTGQPVHAQSDPPADRLGPLGPKPAQRPSREKLLGIEAIEAELGQAIPTGRGIAAAHVEGLRGDYLPRQSLPQFRDVRFTPRSGLGKANGHATATARSIYGSAGVAPGIKDVHVFASAHWLGDGYLNAWTEWPPNHDDRRLFSHSWIRPTGGLISQDILRRVDYVIDTHDVVMCVGLNNGRETAIPAVLGSAYNVIAVGVRSGESSGGYTWFEGKGRCKPDIVSVGGKTSFSTPIVAGIVARLMETADRMAASNAANAAAQRSEVIKAALLAGAQKRDGWQREDGRPLDEHLGAGFARFDYSYRILTAGPADEAAFDPRGGWVFRAAPPGEQEITYDFIVPTAMRDLSVMLTWNRRIGPAPGENGQDGEATIVLSGGKVIWDNTPRLANFDLELIRLDAPVGRLSVQESNSRVDNVEHVFLREVPAGSYRLVVRRHDAIDEPWEYALAWRSRQPGNPDAMDEPEDQAAGDTVE